MVRVIDNTPGREWVKVKITNPFCGQVDIPLAFLELAWEPVPSLHEMADVIKTNIVFLNRRVYLAADHDTPEADEEVVKAFNERLGVFMDDYWGKFLGQ